MDSSVRTNGWCAPGPVPTMLIASSPPETWSQRNMWPVFARTRRRQRQVIDPTAPTATAGGAGVAVLPDLVLTLGRVDLERLGTALQALLGPDVARPDTPARLEVALAAAMQLLGGAGRPRVTRRPPVLYAPVAWQVSVTSVDPAIGDAICGAARGLSFST